MKRTLAIKGAIATLLPSVIGISACCVYLVTSTPLVYKGKEYLISLAFYALVYHGFLLVILLPITLCSIISICSLSRNVWFRTGVILLTLLFLASLVVAPELILRKEATKHYKQWRHQQEKVRRELDFRKSPQGRETAYQVNMLWIACLGKIGASNELVRIINDDSVASPTRLFAQETLRTYDSIATNSYGEIEEFFKTRRMLAKEPSITTNTILAYKRVLELGSSALALHQKFQSDTSLPVLFREDIGNNMSNLFNRTDVKYEWELILE